ncbi:MAG TPA: VOC family protein [Candidatus Binataceae bacterium]|nr:VOC family protein [Candidatus Binataceae bacterium]
MSIRLRQICLVAEKLAPVADDLKSILGLEVCFKDPEVAVFGLENSLFPVGNNFIEVVAPVKENTAGGRYLKRRKGDGGYMVICQCDSHETQLARKARAQALNVRTVMDHEDRKMHVMQLHPADTGGAFFEIDWDAKGEPEGNWTPAGGSGWAGSKRLEVVKAYTAVELQSADPRGLAERWSSIAEIPLAKDSRGRIEMPLANAAVRFVEATDGRGEGLGGIDVVTVDRKRLLEAAEKRGRRISDDQVMICGTRFNLL